MHERLRQQQFCAPRTDDSEEESKFVTGDRVWLKSYFKGKGRGAKLQPKYVGPYSITKVLPFQTYQMERRGKLTVQHEGRIKLYRGDLNEPVSGSVQDKQDPLPEENNPPVTVEERATLAARRSGRNVKQPAHLSDYWLNRMKRVSLPDRPILGQNSVLGGDGVIKMDDKYDTEFPPLSTQNKTLKMEMVALRRAEVVGETTGTQKSILTGSPRGSLSSPIGSTDGRMVLDPTSCL